MYSTNSVTINGHHQRNPANSFSLQHTQSLANQINPGLQFYCAYQSSGRIFPCWWVSMFFQVQAHWRRHNFNCHHCNIERSTHHSLSWTRDTKLANKLVRYKELLNPAVSWISDINYAMTIHCLVVMAFPYSSWWSMCGKRVREGEVFVDDLNTIGAVMQYQHLPIWMINDGCWRLKLYRSLALASHWCRKPTFQY